MFKNYFKNLLYIGAELINNVVLVSGVQQSNSVIHIHMPILFQILFLFMLLQNIEQSSLCYTVGPCWLSVLLTVVCMRARRLNAFSHVWLFATIWTVTHQTPLSMGFSWQEYQSGWHVLLQGIFPTQGSNLCPALVGRFFATSATWEAQ